MPKAMRIHQPGGADAMQWEEIQVGAPGAGEVQLRQHAVGLNYLDVYNRSGLYPNPLPFIVGHEASGVVEAVGAGVTELKAGDRVAYGAGPMGAYCELRNIAADRLIKLPETLGFEQGAAMMLQGMTVQYLLKRTFKVAPGQTILFHAAAGGVGLIACQWARAIGVTIIGTVGSDEKAALARAHGCDHTIVYTRENFVERVKEITRGAGVPVVYDSVGKDTFDGSLDCLQPFGTLVSFGNASGPVAPFSLAKLKGTLYVTRPSLIPYAATRGDLVAGATDLFDMVGSGKVKIEVSRRYALKDAPQAHRDLEARKTTGSTVLIP
ncbi:MAG: quinone oxidoreductase [Betaproteobacteria bacterium]|nr:quinone oxidoreductase [Betaproteobacteria bacterium]